MIKRCFCCFILLLFLPLAGCQGLQLSEESQSLFRSLDGQQTIPADADSFAIETLSGFEGGAGHLFLSRVQYYLTVDGRLAEVRPGGEDLLLSLSFIEQPEQVVTYSRSGEPLQKRAYLGVRLSLYDQRRGVYIFRDELITAFKLYSEIEPPIQNSFTVRRDLEEELAKRVALKVQSGWFTELQQPVERRQ